MERLQLDSARAPEGDTRNLLEGNYSWERGSGDGYMGNSYMSNSHVKNSYEEDSHVGNRSIIMHIALQGCLRSGSIPYGLTADTGGHIRYLLELVEALAQRPEVSHQIIVTRAFDAPHLGEEYKCLEEAMSENVTLWRCQGASSAYLSKEELWRELPHLVRDLIVRMKQTRLQPNLIHAHYADAGVMALRLKAALGIPYVFTAHSLGATKALHKALDAPVDRVLKRRIRLEEIAIKGADRLIASSEHETLVQYGLYRQHDIRKAQVNPPGCDLQIFRTPAPANAAKEVDAELRRFLRQPDRPCLLAIARPVEKKNLYALVKAYGENPRLRERANLVIYAGTRSQIQSGEPEAQQVWQHLLELIDDYDLYGDVAYPKHHELRHVPAIYQWAARRRGVFVNPALNEPFGLTLLEAAAAGLPVVATREGGPVDIVGRCQNGHLVSPTDLNAIAEACHHLLTDDLDWKRYSSRGSQNVNFYTWSRHARQYIQDAGLALPEQSAARHQRPVTQLMATDMDATLLGHWEGLANLRDWLAQNLHYLFVVATGRAVEEAMGEMAAWSAPLPDFLIADVGSSIYRISPHGEPQLIADWHRRLDEGWQREACRRLLEKEKALTPQPESTQFAYKLSYFLDDSRNRAPGSTSKHIVERIERTLLLAGLTARVVHSHDNLIDILPAGGGKARAVEFICEEFGLGRHQVVAAGDSGNDIDLLKYAALGIAVANHTVELEALRRCKNIYWAKTECAAGLLEGLRYWHSLNSHVHPIHVSDTAVHAQSKPVHTPLSRPSPALTSGARKIEAGA
ncbi:MAG: HAD-IIB family hydrolase [Marinobacter sp.]|uniref:HAD-IIB family hydrolase n=1 Tax=Marinobacter sp. TaxID=50741 RepID=UPI0034A017D1